MPHKRGRPTRYTDTLGAERNRVAKEVMLDTEGQRKAAGR